MSLTCACPARDQTEGKPQKCFGLEAPRPRRRQASTSTATGSRAMATASRQTNFLIETRILGRPQPFCRGAARMDRATSQAGKKALRGAVEQ